MRHEIVWPFLIPTSLQTTNAYSIYMKLILDQAYKLKPSNYRRQCKMYMSLNAQFSEMKIFFKKTFICA